jgi:two-component system LytT family sensor kinase
MLEALHPDMEKVTVENFSGMLTTQIRGAFALGLPAFLIVFNFLMIGMAYFSSWPVFGMATLLNGALLTLALWAMFRINRHIASQYDGLDQTLERVAMTVGYHIMIAAMFWFIIACLYVGVHLFGSKLDSSTVLTMFLISLAAILFSTGFEETGHAITRWKMHEVNKERLLKESINGQLESLKAQISPHFLFNTLNSLSALITEDPAKAEQFVDEMARVYRYLLQTNHSSVDEGDFSQLTTLRKELSFIESYNHLLKTRYGEGMKLHIHVEEHFLQHRIPPLTLQLLVENAVKHNVIRVSRPLTIFILSTHDGQLMVRNNLQKKTFTAGTETLESTQVGLANIISKYRLLSEFKPGLPQPVIESSHEFFTVTLPLIS